MGIQHAAEPAAVTCYRLSKLKPLLALPVRLTWILMLAVGFWRPSHSLPSGLGVAIMAIVVVPWLVVLCDWLNIVIAPVPRTLQILPECLRVNWADHTEDLPWETLRWRELPEGALTAAEGRFRLYGCWVDDQERKGFTTCALKAMAAARGRQEALHLAGGDVLRYPARLRALGMGAISIGGVDLGLLGWAIWRSAGVSLNQIDDPLFVPAVVALFGLIILLAFLVTSRLVRQLWCETRFLPDGVEQIWPRGRRFVAYRDVTRLTEKHTESGMSLVVEAGRQRLEFSTLLPLFFGIAELLHNKTGLSASR